MNFSVALLTRNEASTLPRLMASLKPFLERGGEIVCLDGSDDRTPDLARELGCRRVVREPKKLTSILSRSLAEKLNSAFLVKGDQPFAFAGQRLFDLAAARNYLSGLATQDMVFQPDADEVLTRFDLDVIDQAIAGGAECLTYLFVHSHDDQGKPTTSFRHSKFADRRKFHWHTECPVHEVLDGAGSVRWLESDKLLLEHWKNPSPPTSSALTGLAWACHRHPTNARMCHYLGRELMYSGRLKSAIRQFERHVEIGDWQQEKSQSMIHMAWCHGQLGNRDAEIEWLHRAFICDPTRRESLIRLADIYREREDHQHTACWAAAALEIPWTGNYISDPAHYAQVPHDHLYWAKWWLGDRRGSREHWEKCLEICPQDPRYQADAKFYLDYTSPGIDGWMDPWELEWLFRRAREMNSIVEVGAWKGRSTHALATGCPGKVISVDHFLGSRGFDFEEQAHGREVQGDGVFREFCRNTREFANLEVLRMTSLEAADRIKDPVDMVFLDAGHTREELSADIRAWLPKTRKLLCGHDYSPQWPSVMEAVDETLGTVDVFRSIWIKRLP